MCRLFGAISTSPIDADYLLHDAPQSLFHQSCVDRKRKQGDGWGIGWFEGAKPRVFKSPGPIYKDLASPALTGTLSLRERVGGEAARRLTRIRSHCLVGHVRWASNPLKLPRRELIGLPHTQPFTYRRWLFAHNGTLFIPKEVRAELGPLARQIKGNNDSEVLFYWLMKHLRGRKVMPAIRRAVAGLHVIWKTCRKKYPLYKHPYHGLNWALTNGKILIAMCYVNPAGFGKARALCGRGKPYYQLHYKHDSTGWVVASEPLDHGPGWKPMRHGSVLVANARNGRFWNL